MRKLLCTALAVILIFVLTGCKSNSDEITTPVHFYYKNAATSYNREDAVIVSEVRDRSDLTDRLEDQLNIYLQGPLTDESLSPFPAGVNVASVEFTEDTVCIALNGSFTSLEGIDQTIACACLSKTVMELVQYETVEISVNAAASSENISIIMDKQSLLLLDNNYPDAE